MAEQTDLTQQILQNIQQSLTDLRTEMRDGFSRLEVRMSTLESRMSSFEAHIPKLYTLSTGQEEAFSALKRRVERIERRLELADE